LFITDAKGNDKKYVVESCEKNGIPNVEEPTKRHYYEVVDVAKLFG